MPVFRNDVDTYIARDWQHATELWEADYGEDIQDYYEGEEQDGWLEVPCDEEIRIWFHDGPPFNVPPTCRWERKQGNSLVVIATAAAWEAAAPAPGMLCSSEY